MALIRWHIDFSSPVCYYCEVGKRSCVKDIWEKKEKKNNKKRKSVKSSQAQSYKGKKAILPGMAHQSSLGGKYLFVFPL